MVRTYVSLFILVAFAAVVMARTIQINVLERAKWLEKEKELTIVDKKLKPRRGSIYSDDGSMLATSVSMFDIRMDLNTESISDSYFEANVDSLASRIVTHLLPQYTSKEYASILRRRRRSGDRYFLIKRDATYVQVEQVKQFPILSRGRYKGGLILESHVERTLPFGDLARRTIGEVRNNAQDYGLESQYNHFLAGEEGLRKERMITSTISVPVSGLMEIEPRDGYDVYTTIDINIQDVAHNSLLTTLEKYQADHGCVVVMEVETGEIKAISNLKKTRNGVYRDVQNFAVGSLYEPGSTFKAVTYLALMEDYGLDISEEVSINKGIMKVGRHIIRDSEKHDYETVSMKRAFELSSNVGAAKAVIDYYASRQEQQKYIQRMSKLGLREITGVEVPGEVAPRLKDSTDQWNYTYTLPWMSFGYEVSMTPLQVLTFYNAIANGGYRVRPHLLRAIQDGTKVIRKYDAQRSRKRIASKKSIDSLQSMLEGVVLQGTADHLRTQDYSFAGKTGTTQIEYWKGAQRSRYIASFAGYFPSDQPRYSCYVMVYDPKGPVYYGGHVAAPVFRTIADYCMYVDKSLIDSHRSLPTTASTQGFPLYRSGNTDDFQRISEFLGLKIRANTDSKWTVLMPSETEPSFEPRLIDREVIPNVVGMSLKDALYILENQDIRVKTYGRGYVRKQSIPAGSENSGQEIILHLG